MLEELRELERKKHAYHRRMYRYQAHYSLNREDGIEHQMLFPSPSTEEQYEEKVFQQELYQAMSQLSEKSFRRIYAHYILGLSKVEIARLEGVDERVVRLSIERGLNKLNHLLNEKDN
ncbi:RNA polymerase sigma factor [Salicibibacter cibi]|uniref:RNA polymerase sigma factor n=1 Tax=Salicibibacter cibi TaxID=2743001 RepID=UPI001FEB51FC|nr:sigma factor-like helix-turn-helix DNA-binding protein [Salicibibacter cibi]